MFGERIWFRPLKSYTAGAGRLENKLMSGRYIGTHGRNGDIMAMTSEGVIKGSNVKRMTQQERWDPSDMEKLRGTPWNLRPRMAGDVDSLPIPIELPKVEEGEKLLPEPAQRDSAPRSLYVKRKDVEGHYTPGCPGCIALQVGAPVRSHNSECRTSVEQRLRETEEGKLRVETARKRKAETGTEGEEQIALEDVPDAEEEMHAPDAVGSPPRERVEPLVRPSPSRKRSSEEGSPEGSKKAKADEAKGQGTKRALDPTQDERTFKQLMDEIKQDQKRSKDESSSSASASTAGRPERAQATKDVASILQSRIMASAPEEEVLEIGQLLMPMSGSKVDVAEIYNPKRVTSQANRFGLRPGFAIDLTLCKNEQGEHWDLSKKEDQKMLRELQRKEKPALLIGSPPCGPFSPLQNLSKNKRTPEQNAEILAEGKTHLKVATDAYLEQHRNDRFFLHEHPKPSSSWEEDEIKRLTELEGIHLVVSHVPLAYDLGRQ